MSEPFGALLASMVANEDSSPAMFGGMFGLTAGMMTFVCIAELLPAAYVTAPRGALRGLLYGGLHVGVTRIIFFNSFFC